MPVGDAAGFNLEINIHVNAPLKVVFLYMEQVLRILDIHNARHIGACQMLGICVLRHANDHRVHVHDITSVRRAVGPAVGKPCNLREQRPHPTGLLALPAGLDFVAEYERATHRPLRREPRWAAARDPLHHRPDRQAARNAAVMAIWGSTADVWADICNNIGRACAGFEPDPLPTRPGARAYSPMLRGAVYPPALAGTRFIPGYVIFLTFTQ